MIGKYQTHKIKGYGFINAFVNNYTSSYKASIADV